MFGNTGSTENVFHQREDMAERGYLSEIFCSIQGEGLFIGERQIFVRTAGCSTSCSFCDTEGSRSKTSRCAVYGKKKLLIPNPIPAEAAVREVNNLLTHFKRVGTVSFTGGEPLEQSRFVAAVAEPLRRKKLNIYLDTNGIEVEGLRDVFPFIDVISMDIKLPTATGRSYWSEHEEFLRRSKQTGGKKTVFIKIVIGGQTLEEEVEKAAVLISGVNPDIPLVLQPERTLVLSGISPQKKNQKERTALSKRLMDYQAVAMRYLSHVRVIPQSQVILDIM